MENCRAKLDRLARSAAKPKVLPHFGEWWQFGTVVRKGSIKLLLIERIDLSFQPPENLIPETVAAIASAIRARKRIRPVYVYSDGTNFWLADGFHRVAAAIQCGRKRIAAEVVRGTYPKMDTDWQHQLKILRRALRKKTS